MTSNFQNLEMEEERLRDAKQLDETLEWQFCQVFGERSPAEEIQDGMSFFFVIRLIFVRRPLLSQVFCPAETGCKVPQKDDDPDSDLTRAYQQYFHRFCAFFIRCFEFLFLSLSPLSFCSAFFKNDGERGISEKDQRKNNKPVHVLILILILKNSIYEFHGNLLVFCVMQRISFQP